MKENINKIIIQEEKPIQIKCYCGHTTYCDCSPLEEPKQEISEEAKKRATNYMKLKGALEPKENNHINDTNEMVELPQQETLYTEEQVREAIESFRKTRIIYDYEIDEIIQSLKQPKKD